MMTGVSPRIGPAGWNGRRGYVALKCRDRKEGYVEGAREAHAQGSGGRTPRSFVLQLKNGASYSSTEEKE